ncbi:heavy metal translocating P-type ATPase metal-binding domain-containing protein [Zhouia spongiae]|uniref:Heavy metal translocating P-type ATPase metal-binding domain-containing protein n=1 Tax=Zhouia spongiae TaxID=2202721 RepID=A0ABY3YNI3_9FLAO|nr:heavy metal translocating P-type ATPase metal-binding domain-containing protein [Zhouia spongiae]UNY99175.1 heavy metal translocating P-type ATPase metal-binding domain-containing protein [Zhouia spongiae]
MIKQCYHCGTECDTGSFVFDSKDFCCNGCKTVYQIFSENDLAGYYELEKSPGASPLMDKGKFDFLDNDKIVEKLLEFNDGDTQIINLYIPHIHCSSCIWVLENLNKLNSSIRSSLVNFPKKTVRITYNSKEIPLKALVLLLNTIGYEPYISLEDYQQNKKGKDRSLIYKLGIAGFAFGNVMLLSFPEYFEVDEFWLNQYKHFFRWIMFTLSLPVVFYAASDYFVSAYKGIRSKILNIDIPIALGIAVLFIRSTYEIITNTGQGFFDSLTGLLFFLLLGKFFQQKTYSFLSFERDYKSYFPIGITKINNDGTEESIQVYDIKQGDKLLIRNEELIPVDSILLRGKGKIDYSFVTGEAEAVSKQSGDKLFAGGKQTGEAIELEALKSVSQSYLTQLWSNDVFAKDKHEGFINVTDSISRYFTIVVLLIAFGSAGFWLWYDPTKAMNVFTAILIVACPCALALSAPFTLGNMLRIFGKNKFYLKNAHVLEQLARVNSIIFDKTGTITSNKETKVSYEGDPLDTNEESLLKNTLRNSNHPLSRQLYSILKENEIITLDEFNEYAGKGIEATHRQQTIKLGSAEFIQAPTLQKSLRTSVHIASNNKYKGKYTFYNSYRNGLSGVFNRLKGHYEITILSGDNESERENLEKLVPSGTKIFFNQKPEEKLNYIKYHQQSGANIMMVGDGLNDAGALRQSNVGVAIAENVNVFTPASDAILDASKFNLIPKYLWASKKAMNVIIASFILSFLYNTVGLAFAISGNLSPVIAAILMPLSSISIVVFTTIMTNMIGKSLNKRI